MIHRKSNNIKQFVIFNKRINIFSCIGSSDKDNLFHFS